MAAVINEVQSRHNPPPSGMMSCKSFTWSVDDFNEKRKWVSSAQRPAWENMFLLVALFIAQYIAYI
jgi:hypothetical protein